MRSIAVWLVIAFLHCVPAFAYEIEWRHEPVSLEGNWADFLDETEPYMTQPEHFLSREGSGNVDFDKAYLKIASLKEIPHTLILAFNYPAALNMALLRASIFIEKLEALHGERAPLDFEGSPIVRNEELLAAIPEMVGGGHDLRGEDLLNFWRVMDQVDPRHFGPVKASPLNSLLSVERETRVALEPILREHPQTAIIAISINYYSSAVLSHEISHAQFFNNPTYRDAVWKYWNSMTPEDQERARVALSQNGIRYNGDSIDLIVNEFQAFLNQINAHFWPMLESLHDPHFALFRAHLLNSVPGIRLVEIPHPLPEFRLSFCRKYLLASVP